jgi:cell fate (sporulation/competence/biofilm development) regulator YlbF (YheA/YmcA/DUF963 family)
MSAFHGRYHTIFQFELFRGSVDFSERLTQASELHDCLRSDVSTVASVILSIFMSDPTPQDVLQQKALELCNAIVALPGFAETHQKVQAFMEDELIKFEFQMVNNRVQLLTEKQAAGLPVTPEEISELEAFRDATLNKEVAKGFISAQAELDAIQKLIYPMLAKTFELGRVPTSDDFLNDNCDSSCGLH